MLHIMKIDDSAFERMKKGVKKRKYRVNDEKGQSVRIGDIIEFQKISNPQEKISMDVKEIEHFSSLREAISSYFEEDFSGRHSDIDSAVASFYQNGYCKEEEVEKNGIVVFALGKHRPAYKNATICYLRRNDEVLMIKYTKKWNKLYGPPGGKFETGETPLECIMREFKEETGLTLVNPKLQGVFYWKKDFEEKVFAFTADDYEGNLTLISDEGMLEWIKLQDLDSINQFDLNKKLTSYLFKNEIFEGKFFLDDDYKVIQYQINKM